MGHLQPFPLSALRPEAVLGGVLFGFGWALAGVCPGPAIVACSSAAQALLLWVPGLIAGLRIADAVH